ncbi:MAG: DUF6880 family protein, partial [Specibacter sp.]
ASNVHNGPRRREGWFARWCKKPSTPWGVLRHADDSNGSIGDVFRHLLNLHARLCREAPPATAQLVKWMIRFQFGDGQDFFMPDPVDYAPALGPKGLAKYQAGLDKVAETIPAETAPEEKRAALKLQSEDPGTWERVARHNHARFVLHFNAERLAVAHRDTERIIGTHAGDQSRSYKLHNTAKALAEIAETGLAIEWAKRGALLEEGHQGEAAGEYWCQLLHEHRVEVELDARGTVFERWPSAVNATRLHGAAAEAWPSMQTQVLTTLSQRPDDYIEFLLVTLQDVPLAWTEAHRVDLGRVDLWDRLIATHGVHDPAAVLPVLEGLIEGGLTVADVRNDKMAVSRLSKHRAIATAAGHPEATAALLASLRESNSNRPRLLRELDRLKF